MSSKDKRMVDAYDKKSKPVEILNEEKLHGLVSVIEEIKETEASTPKPDGIIKRKLTRIFGALGDVQTMFFTGFKMGFMVGGIFGGIMGVYYAVTTRSLLYVPMAALGSGASFGFFMGIGMVMRTEMEEAKSESDELYTQLSIGNDGLVSRSRLFNTLEI